MECRPHPKISRQLKAEEIVLDGRRRLRIQPIWVRLVRTAAAPGEIRPQVLPKHRVGHPDPHIYILPGTRTAIHP
jgi:hypothetical protein